MTEYFESAEHEELERERSWEKLKPKTIQKWDIGKSMNEAFNGMPDLAKSFETLKLSIDLYSAVDPESVFGYSVRKAIDEKRTIGAIMMCRDQCWLCPAEMTEMLGEELFTRIKNFKR